MEYTTPIIDVNELQETIEPRGCTSFTCKPSTFTCNSYNCSGTFTCSGW